MSKSFSVEENDNTLKVEEKLQNLDIPYRVASISEKQTIDAEWQNIKRYKNIQGSIIYLIAILGSIILFYQNIMLMLSLILIWILLMFLTLILSSKDSLYMPKENYMIVTGICVKKDFCKKMKGKNIT